MFLTTIKNKRRTLQAMLLLGVPLTTTLLLLIGSMMLHIPGLSLISFAHAAEAGKMMKQAPSLHVCASYPTEARCNNQNPNAQGCDKDAQTLALKEITNTQGELLATTQRRYSPTCHSEWGRILRAPNNHQPIGITIAKSGEWVSSGPFAFTTMVFVPNLSIASQIIGTANTNGIAPDQIGSQGLSAILPALPAVQVSQK